MACFPENLAGRPVATSLLALLCSAGSAGHGAARGSYAATGRLEGIATIAPVLTAAHRRIRVYDEPGTPPPQPAPQNPMANVVIYLDAAPALRGAGDAGRGGTPGLRQRDETFVPHVLPVLVGSTVDFPNDDPLFHDVFSLSPAHSFDLHRYGQGQSRSQLFARTGVVEVFCHIHADMSAYILVLDNPFYVTPDASGHFALDGIPPGDYRMVAWYERSRPVMTRVHIDADRATHQDVRIPIPSS